MSDHQDYLGTGSDTKFRLRADVLMLTLRAHFTGSRDQRRALLLRTVIRTGSARVSAQEQNQTLIFKIITTKRLIHFLLTPTTKTIERLLHRMVERGLILTQAILALLATLLSILLLKHLPLLPPLLMQALSPPCL